VLQCATGVPAVKKQNFQPTKQGLGGERRERWGRGERGRFEWFLLRIFLIF
jgi:hypothetical protein